MFILLLKEIILLHDSVITPTVEEHTLQCCNNSAAFRYVWFYLFCSESVKLPFRHCWHFFNNDIKNVRFDEWRYISLWLWGHMVCFLFLPLFPFLVWSLTMHVKLMLELFKKNQKIIDQLCAKPGEHLLCFLSTLT